MKTKYWIIEEKGHAYRVIGGPYPDYVEAVESTDKEIGAYGNKVAILATVAQHDEAEAMGLTAETEAEDEESS